MMYYHYIIMQMSRNQPTIRTQISLTPEIKQAIEAKKRLTGESLSAYLREAALMRMKTEEDKKKELEKLADMVVGSIDLKNYPEWRTKKKLQVWLRKLRNEWE